MSNTENLVKVARELSKSVGSLSFELPTAYIYNPLEYAWSIHEQYLKLAGQGKKKVVFLATRRVFDSNFAFRGFLKAWMRFE